MAKKTFRKPPFDAEDNAKQHAVVRGVSVKPGEIRQVSGGYGLMYVLSYDASKGAAEMVPHGPKPEKWNRHSRWFFVNRLSAPVSAEMVSKESREARARGVACGNPDCWCRKYDPLCPTCGKNPPASPSSNLCGNCLMGRKP